MSSNDKTSRKDSYGPPLPITEKQIVVGSSPTSSSGTRAQAVLVSPSQFNQRITASQRSTGSPLAYYSPPPLERTNFITKDIALPIIPLESHYCPEGSSLLQITSKIFPPGFWFLPKDLLKTREYYEFIFKKRIHLLNFQNSKLTKSYLHLTGEWLLILKNPFLGFFLHNIIITLTTWMPGAHSYIYYHLNTPGSSGLTRISHYPFQTGSYNGLKFMVLIKPYYLIML
jgi:hypothetical protein